MTKPGKYGPEYSREREVKVILEDLQSQFRVFGEGLIDVRERVGRIEGVLEQLGQIKEDVSLIKLAFPDLSRKVANHDRRITALETTP